MIKEAIHFCKMEIRAELYRTIILAGGTCLFSGLRDRIIKELERKKVPRSEVFSELKTIMGVLVKNPSSKYDINVLAPPNRLYSAWAGGAQLASQGYFEKRWITKAQYIKGGLELINPYVL